METAEKSVAPMLRKFFDIAVRSADTDARWKAVIAFCDIVVREPLGPFVAIKFLGAEMQSTSEPAALKALDILEACVRQCGPRFQAEVGKFRFLNEMVKLVSPRYFGNRTTEKVKSKVKELLYVWTQSLPHEPKVREAYDMLKGEKLIDENPDVPLCTNVVWDSEPRENGSETRVETQDSCGSSAGPRRADDIFTNDERSQRIQKLLQSKNPHDLQEANKLIKRIVSENEQRQAKASWRASELGRVHTIVGVLSEMLSAHQPSASSEEEKDTLKQLYSSCKELRTGLPKIADQTEDAEKDALVNIVKASEDLDAVIKDYEFVVDGRGSPSVKRKAASKGSEPAGLFDLDLLNLSSGEAGDSETKDPLDPSQMLEEVFGAPSVPPRLPPKGNGVGTLGDSLDYLLLADFSSGSSSSVVSNTNLRHAMGPMSGMRGASQASRYIIDLPKPGSTSASETKVASSASSSVFEDIEKMARDRLPVNKPSAPPSSATRPVALDSSVAQKSEDRESTSQAPSSTPAVENVTRVTEKGDTCNSQRQPPVTPLELSNLDDISLSLDDVKPGEGSPIVLLDSDDVSLLLSSAVVDSRPGLSVGVLTFANKSKSPVTDYVFKAVFTPKTVPTRVLPASGTQLPPSRPFVPSPVVTQLIIVNNPEKVPVSMKYVVCFTKGDDLESERGTVSNLLA